MIKLAHQEYIIDKYHVNCHHMTISYDGNTVKLRAKVFELLKLLIENANKTVTKEQAIDLIWSGNIQVGKRALGNAIWQLRNAFAELGADPEKIFRTINKVGYSLLITPEIIEEKVSPSTSEYSQEGILDITTIAGTDNKSVSSIFISQKHWFISLAIIIVLLLSFLKATSIEPNKDKPNNLQFKATRITNFEGVEELPAISSNGKYIAFQWLQQHQPSKIFIKDLHNDSAPLRQVSIASNNEVSPTWSPDSNSLAYFRTDDKGISHLYIRELITNRELLIDSEGGTLGYMRTISWSPNGEKIAFSKKLSDRTAIFQYQLSDQSISQFTFPNTGEQDRLMVWSENSESLAYVRSAELTARLMLIDEQQQSQVLIDNEKMIIGLDWHYAKNNLYYNVARDADFVIESYDFSTKESKEYHRDQTIYSVAIDQSEQQLYYSRHISQEHISNLSLTTGQVKEQLVSSSRDIYGQYVPATGDILFFSNRGGVWELWLRHNDISTQLTDIQSAFTIPTVSPTEEKFVVAIKADNDENFKLHLGELPSGKLTQLFEIDGDVRKPSFSQNGKSLYFSSNKHGHWGIYKFNFETGTFALLIEENGKYAIESNDGGIYFTKDNEAGIFYLSKDGKHSSTITPNLSVRDWGNFFLKGDDLYYLHRTKDNDILKRIDANGEEHIAFSLPTLSIRNEKSLSLGVNNSVIATMLGINDADIYRVPLP